MTDEEVIKDLTKMVAARNRRLEKAQALIEHLMGEYDLWDDEEIVDQAAAVCDWEECFVCNEKRPKSRGKTVQTEPTVMYTRNGDGYPGAWDFICDRCAEKDGDCD